MNTSRSTKQNPTRRSPAQWQAIMSAYNTSGLTQEAFCAQQALAPSTFYAWRKRLGSQPVNEAATPVFIDVSAHTKQLPSAPPSQWDVELSLGNGTVLRLRHPA